MTKMGERNRRVTCPRDHRHSDLHADDERIWRDSTLQYQRRQPKRVIIYLENGG